MSLPMGTCRCRALPFAATALRPSRPPPGKTWEAARADHERRQRSPKKTRRRDGERPARRPSANVSTRSVRPLGAKQAAKCGYQPCQIQADHRSPTRRGLQFRAFSQPGCRRGSGYRMPRPFREILVLRELEKLSYHQISEITAPPIGTVMSRLARARRAFGDAWRRETENGG
jgi:Sigma-70, region 4